MDSQETLRQTLIGYFGDQSLEEGAAHMVFVTEGNPEYHSDYRGALNSGIDAPSEGDDTTVRLITDSDAAL